MHRGVIGTLHLNQVLQAALNPNPVLIDRTGSRFKARDKVMHLKNNYLKDVFNGDIGTITDVNRADESLVV